MPSSKYACRFLTRLPRLVSSFHDVHPTILANNLTNLLSQALFTLILSEGRSLSLRLHSQYVSMLINSEAIKVNEQGDQSMFLKGFPSAMFKVTDTLCSRGEELHIHAATTLVQWFALYMTNSNFFWPWQKW